VNWISSRRVPSPAAQRIEGGGRVFARECILVAAGADTVTVTKNEVLTALNKPDDYFLAIVTVDGDEISNPMYVSRPFSKEPEFFMTSLDCKIADLRARSETPC
jgi:hypothetical protein